MKEKDFSVLENNLNVDMYTKRNSYLSISHKFFLSNFDGPLKMGYTMQLRCIRHESCIMIDPVGHTKTLFHATLWSCIQLSFG